MHFDKAVVINLVDVVADFYHILTGCVVLSVMHIAIILVYTHVYRQYCRSEL